MYSTNLSLNYRLVWTLTVFGYSDWISIQHLPLSCLKSKFWFLVSSPSCTPLQWPPCLNKWHKFLSFIPKHQSLTEHASVFTDSNLGTGLIATLRGKLCLHIFLWICVTCRVMETFSCIKLRYWYKEFHVPVSTVCKLFDNLISLNLTDLKLPTFFPSFFCVNSRYPVISQFIVKYNECNIFKLSNELLFVLGTLQ